MATSLKRVRNQVLAGTLLQISRAESVNEFALWCDHWWLSTRPSVQPSDKPNAKWAHFLKGSTPHCLNLLLDRFPPMQKAMDNQLWDVLGWDTNSHLEAEKLVFDRLGSRGVFAPRLSQTVVNSQMSSWMGVPTWHNLALALALLMSRSPGLQRHRRWMIKHFTAYFTVACLDTLMHPAAYGLWQLVDNLFRGEVAARPTDWPSRMCVFDAYLEDWEGVYEILPTMNWSAEHSPRWEPVGLAWCFHLGGRDLLNHLMDPAKTGEGRYPRILRQRLNSLEPADPSVFDARIGLDLVASYRPVHER